jgi:hypothetical protein
MDVEELRRLTEEARKQKPAIEERQRQEAAEQYRQKVEKDRQEKIKEITSQAESAARRGENYCIVITSGWNKEIIVHKDHLPSQVREAGTSATIISEAEMQFLSDEAKAYVKYGKELGFKPSVEVKNMREEIAPNTMFGSGCRFNYRAIKWSLKLTW